MEILLKTEILDIEFIWNERNVQSVNENGYL